MKLRKVIKYTAAVSLGLAGLIVLGGYGWLYSWKWSSAPSAHAGWSADEIHRLQKMDEYLTTQAVQANYLTLQQNWMYNEGEEEDGVSWMVQVALRLLADWESKLAFAPAREALHDFIASATAQDNASALAVLTLMKGDVPTFKLLAEKSGAVDLREFPEGVMYCAPPGRDCMPVAQRLELLDWMSSKGVNLNACIRPHRFVRMMQHSMLYSDDSCGEMLNWFLRHGYQLDAADAAGLFLLQTDASLPTWQKLIEDGVLPDPPPELKHEGELRSLLQIVTAADKPAPETLRWLLSLGHQPNAVPAAPADDTNAHRRVPIDVCLNSVRYAIPGQSEEEDSRLRGKVEMLDVLLQHGAVPTSETRELLPLDRGLDKEITEIFRKHSFHLDAGDNPYNACCIPE